MGGEEILQQSTSEQHYFHLFSAAGVVLSTQGSFYGESAIVSTPDSKDGRHLCSCLTQLSIIPVVLTSTSLAQMEPLGSLSIIAFKIKDIHLYT